jgi:hypothetical protein
MDIRYLEKEIHKVLAPLVSTQLIIAEQNAPAPSNNYITINLANARQIGQQESTQPNASGIMTLKLTYLIDLEVGGLKSTTKSDIFKLAALILGSPLVVDGFISLGLGVGALTGVSDRPMLIQGAIEERSEFTVALHYVDSYSVDVGFIDKANIEGTYKNPNDETILVETIEVDFPD